MWRNSGHWLPLLFTTGNCCSTIPCLTKKYGESGTKMTPTRTTTGKMVQTAEIQRQSCPDTPRIKRQVSKNEKIKFVFVFFFLFDRNFYRFWSSNKWKRERKTRNDFGVTSHPRRLVAKIPADIMAENSIPSESIFSLIYTLCVGGTYPRGYTQTLATLHNS